MTQFETCPFRPEKLGTEWPLRKLPAAAGSRGPPALGAGIGSFFRESN